MKTTATQRRYAGASAKVRLLAMLAILSAASIVLGKFLQIPIGDSIRISFENLPIIFAGILFGPSCGAAVGIVADLIGCLAVGFAINPVITLGAAMIGAVSGIVSKILTNDGKYSFGGILLAVLFAHILGSILVKTVGLRLWYTTPWTVLALRVPVYLTNTVIESLVITILLKSSAIKGALRKFNGPERKE